MRSHTSCRSAAFTRLEILACTAALTLLVGLAFASVTRWRAQEHESRCQSNLRHLGTALWSHMQDTSEFPLWASKSVADGKTNRWLWMRDLERRLLNIRDFPPGRFRGGEQLAGSTWDCPAEPDGAYNPHDHPDLGYGYNAWGTTTDLSQPTLGLGGKLSALSQTLPQKPTSVENSTSGDGVVGNGFEQPADWPRVPVKVSEVVNPERMLALGDGVSGWGDFVWSSTHFTRKRPVVDPTTLSPYNPGRHQGNANACFVDGHVETLSLHRLFADPSEGALRMWNRDDDPHALRWRHARPVRWGAPQKATAPTHWFTKRELQQ
ncbi:MAG: hypothetical protein J0L84_17780 [Verrucomicrobia bacterium]|nr:hypothetical protein [Verrucomicrobiota bacterium]